MTDHTIVQTGATVPGVDDKRLELAYDAAVKALNQQDTTLGNLRTRATGLLSAITLATSFAAGLGLFGTDPSKGVPLPTWAKWTLLVLIVAVGTLCLAVMWPVSMCFGVDAAKVLQRRAEGDDVNDIRLYVVDELVKGRAANAEALAGKFRFYRWAVGILTAETAVLIVALIL